MEVSFVSLMRQLCELHVESINEDHRSYQPFHTQGFNNQQLIKLFRKKAHNAYFEYLKKLSSQKKINNVKAVAPVSGLNNQFVQLLSWVIVHLQQKKHNDAQQLQQLVQKLLEFDSSELESVLKFLLCLAGSGKEKKHLLGYQNTDFKWKKTSSYPLAGLDYIRDTQKYSSEKASFMYYPFFTRDMFEVNGLDCSHKWQSIFSNTPGEGLSKSFHVRNVLNDQHEQHTQNTLFGALTQRNVYNLDIKLELPDLSPNQQRYLTFRNSSFPVSEVTSSSSSDEGYRELSPTEVGTPLFDLHQLEQSDSGISSDSNSSKSIWELALNFEPSKHYTWEVVGKHPGLRERPYLSEAGPRAVDELFTVKLNELSLLCPSLKKTCKIFLSVEQLVKDILHLLIAVPSQTFHLSKEGNKFFMKDWICVSGLTPTALDSMLSLYVESGTIYYRLSLISNPPISKFSDSGGLTSQAFTRAVNNFLQYYRARILSLPTEMTLLQLNFCCHRLMKQMRFMSDLCKCDQYDGASTTSPLPGGLKLLNYLYKKTVEAWDTDNYFLLLSLFQTSCIPFALYLQNWVFDGVCKDEYGEFMIRISDNVMHLTGKENWKTGFQLETSASADNIPEFLVDIVPDIFTCGQSLNLLRICCPQHFICNVDCSDVPQVQFFHSQAELKELQQYSQCYFSRMNQIAVQRIQSRQERKEQLAQMKKDLAIKAREVAINELKLMNDEIEAVRKSQQQKKQAELKFLKEQMEEAHLRKFQEKQAAQEESKREAELLNHKEQVLLKAKAMMEEEIKEKIIKHYADLSEQATLREERALWHVRRSRLDAARMEFLLEDEKKWKAEMAEWKKNSKLVEQNKDTEDGKVNQLAIQEPCDSLPHSDMKGHKSTVDYLDVDQDENLPSWAKKKKENSLPADQLSDTRSSGDIFAKENLPSWAVKGCHGEGPEADELTRLDSIATAAPSFGFSKAGGDPPIYIQSEELEILQTKPQVSKSESLDTDGAFTESSDLQQHVPLRKRVADQSVSKETMNDLAVEKVAHSRKSVKGQSISKENFGATPEQKLVASRKPVEDQSISKETIKTSPGDIAIFRRKGVENQLVSKEAADTSQEEQVVPRRKRVDNQSVSKEMQDTASGEQVILRRKRVDNQSVLQETVDVASGDQVIPRRKRIDTHSIGKESSESTLNYRHSGIFISSSLVTQGNYEIEPPAWKQPEELYAQETDMKDFSIRRMSGVYPANEFHLEPTVSQVHRSQVKPHNKMSSHMSSTTESESVDREKLLRERFKQRNVHGHSSDSTVQKLLYGRKFGIHNDAADKKRMGDEDSQVTEDEFEAMFKAWKNSMSQPYDTEFDFEGDRLVNIDRDLSYIVHGRSGIRSKASIGELEAYQYTPLPVLIQQSILAPLTSQIELVNKCALDYFFVELSLDEHFTAFWNYLLMGDGDFAQNLTDLLFEKLSTNPHPNEVLNPMFLNGTLRKSLKSSMCHVNKCTDNLSFEVVQKPGSFLKGDGNQILDCLNLAYKIKWPLNIIVTQECHQKYQLLYSFLLQLKQAIWLLQQIWRQLKRDASINRVGHVRKSTQFHQVQTFQHIMREFVRALQDYFVNQVLHLSWTEFQKALNSNVHNLDDLHHVHMDFLNMSIKRSLLSSQASHVMTMIKNLFNLIKAFYQTLTSQSWYRDPNEGDKIKHPNFSRLLKLYEEFTKYAKVFFKVITGLAQRRYEPHLQDLVLLLNFNHWFTDR